MSIERLPVFPLNAPLLPGCCLPLQIFEKRYLDMVSHCMRTETGFVVSLLKSGSERQEVYRSQVSQGQSGPPFFEQGTLATIVDFGRRDNGLLAITIEGTQRRNLSNCEQLPSGLWQADSEIIVETGSASGEDKAILADLLERVLKVSSGMGERIKPSELTTEQLMNYLIMILPLSAEIKQSLSDLRDRNQRWQQLRETLATLIHASQSSLQ